MKWGITIALFLAGCLGAASRLSAQAPAGDGQKQSAPQQPSPQTGSNPFPTDTSDVPLMPSKGDPALPEGTPNDNARVPLPGEDTDPARSPDDAAAGSGSSDDQNSSSSLSGMDKLLPKDGDGERDRRGRLIVKEPVHQETAAEDVNVGGYYLERKDWKAALSRFQSAMVLDPENPDVYWGMAEADRHVGNFADARANYQRVVDYDPDGKHGKEAKKALKEPEIANAQTAAHAPANVSPK
jgi:Tetratricopeptide repeat